MWAHDVRARQHNVVRPQQVRVMRDRHVWRRPRAQPADGTQQVAQKMMPYKP